MAEIHLPHSIPIVIEAVLDIALHGTVRANLELEPRLGLSSRYLEPYLQALVATNILYSKHGPGGGYYLARSADQITLAEIFRLVTAVLECHPTGGEPWLCENRYPKTGAAREVVRATLEGADALFMLALEQITVANLLARAASSQAA